MNPETYMQQAIAIAKQAHKDGGVAIGSLIINENGKIVATGESLVGVLKDPTAHAEIQAIRYAATKNQSDDLYGYTLFSTLEPCHMCLSAAAWARITTIYFGAYRKDVDATLFDTLHGPSDEQEAANLNLRELRKMRIQGGILESDCALLLDGYHELYKHTKI